MCQAEELAEEASRERKRLADARHEQEEQIAEDARRQADDIASEERLNRFKESVALADVQRRASIVESCPQCNRVVSGATNICMDCGKILQASCANCGQSNFITWKVCVGCGLDAAGVEAVLLDRRREAERAALLEKAEADRLQAVRVAMKAAEESARRAEKERQRLWLASPEYAQQQVAEARNEKLKVLPAKVGWSFVAFVAVVVLANFLTDHRRTLGDIFLLPFTLTISSAAGYGLGWVIGGLAAYLIRRRQVPLAWSIVTAVSLLLVYAIFNRTVRELGTLPRPAGTSAPLKAHSAHPGIANSTDRRSSGPDRNPEFASRRESTQQSQVKTSSSTIKSTPSDRRLLGMWSGSYDALNASVTSGRFTVSFSLNSGVMHGRLEEVATLHSGRIVIASASISAIRALRDDSVYFTKVYVGQRAGATPVFYEGILTDGDTKIKGEWHLGDLSGRQSTGTFEMSR